MRLSNMANNSESVNKKTLWKEVTEAHLDFAWQIAKRFLTNHEDIQDAIQAAFIKAWKSYQQYDAERSLFSTWFFTILKNTCIDYQRQQKRRQKQPDTELTDRLADSNQNVADQLENQELYQLILSLADELPLMQKECFMLRDVQGYSMKEIAEQTGQTEGSVKTNVYLARKKLRQWITEKKLI